MIFSSGFNGEAKTSAGDAIGSPIFHSRHGELVGVVFNVAR